ncbi:prepilin-type N-terminal cleavage/methylation domain-containing protein [Vibrio halioticoli]|nr:prepilin-type N-terminal cleavage/methylation domain-containing protein [Vibrio halioticoli]
MKRQGGFTLIELVVVIVILGVLAVTAAPRFLNLQSDAHKSSLQGLKGAITSAASIVYSKSVIEGKETQPSSTLIENIDTAYGYPSATSTGILLAIQSGSDSDKLASGIIDDSLFATFSDTASGAMAIKRTHCYVTYTQASSSALPTVDVEDSGC